ncbi:MAG: hypothetical protein EHM28_08565 [Spirochaetaceae bacterium]|nr:MAG: hypothetical protein EHM28_08565 [Spirochaetaceae bacterium]
MQKKIFYFSGNEKKTNITILLENLFYQKKLEKQQPLFVESEKDFFLTSTARTKKKGKSYRLFDLNPDLEVMSIPLDKLKALAAGKKQGELAGIDDQFTDVYLSGDCSAESIPMISVCDYLVLLVRNDIYATGYLYNIMKLFKKYSLAKKIVIIISDVKRIEEAGAIFLSYVNELKKMLPEGGDLVFGGYFSLDIKRLVYSAQRREPLVKTFPGCTMHGTIKYIDRMISGLETYFHDLPPLIAIASALNKVPDAAEAGNGASPGS